METSGSLIQLPFKSTIRPSRRKMVGSAAHLSSRARQTVRPRANPIRYYFNRTLAMGEGDEVPQALVARTR